MLRYSDLNGGMMISQYKGILCFAMGAIFHSMVAQEHALAGSKSPLLSVPVLILTSTSSSSRRVKNPYEQIMPMVSVIRDLGSTPGSSESGIPFHSIHEMKDSSSGKSVYRLFKLGCGRAEEMPDFEPIRPSFLKSDASDGAHVTFEFL